MFNYLDPSSAYYKSFFPVNLQIQASSSLESIFIRLLSGTLDIENKFTGDVINQRLNYGLIPYQTITRVSAKPIRDCYSPKSLLSLSKYIDVNENINKKFYTSLLREVTHYFHCKQKGAHMAGFVHLYRVLEFISYSFPLIHSSKSRDYFGTFESLKKYFQKEGGELQFLNRFVQKLFDSRPEILLDLELNISGYDNDSRNKIYNSFKSILTEKNSLINFDDSLKQLTFKYKDFIEIVIHLRNRYFHFATGGYQRNIKTSEIVDPDIFFETINDDFLNWIYVIYGEIVKHLCD